MNMKTKMHLRGILVPHGKQAFIRKIPKGGKVLDLGCGNNSPKHMKTSRPDIEYWGIDVGNYNTEKPAKYADHYILSEAENFDKTIRELPTEFDAIISSHNIEHCNHPKETMEAFFEKLKKGGMLYFAFPSEASANFPSREGTLNFYDDETHIYMPKYEEIIGKLSKDFKIIFSRRQYQPLALAVMGGVLEPFSKRKGKVMIGTWAFYGFETKIWAIKK